MSDCREHLAMKSEPGAIATGSAFIAELRICQDRHPVAIAPGTDLTASGKRK
jgi:hypothetical protein